MAKKKQSETSLESQRQSRKEVLLERRHSQQTRSVRIVIGIVVAIIVLIMAVAIINEYFVVPSRVVASAGSDEITLADWQERVRYQRAQFIINMEDQLESFGDLGLVQQFNGQQMQLLQEGEELGRLILEQMVDEQIVRQEAERRGITVSDEEVDEIVAERFSYYGGDSPTPLPTATETVMPTPSITPIPTDVITDVLPTQEPLPTATLGPTQTPPPTATPVSEESFTEQLTTELDRYRSMGVSEAVYRAAIAAQLLQEKLADALAEEQELETEADHLSAYVISFSGQESAEEALADIESSDFLSVWNRIRSLPPDPESEEQPPSANEFFWRTRDEIEQGFSVEIADTLFSSDLNTPTGVLVVTGASEEQPDRYYILMVSGNEVRPLAEGTVDSLKSQLVVDLVQAVRSGDLVEISQFWRTRVPRNPLLDPSFLVPPTPTALPATLPPPEGTEDGG